MTSVRMTSARTSRPSALHPALAFVLALPLALAGCADAPAPMPRASQEPAMYRSLAASGAVVDAEAARAMISLYRANKGLGALTIDSGLQAAAQAQARAMAADGRISHDSHGSLTRRLNAAGYGGNNAVENVSAGYHTLAEAFSGWRDSPPHNANMLARGMKRMGIATAYAPGAKYKVFWALVLTD
ncbi:MAG: CAP domain-containing protein [Rhodoblastus sp.]